MRPLIDPAEAQRRLSLVFPKAGFDTVLSNPLAAWAVAAMIYVNAVADEAPETWARPSTILWQRPSVLVDHGSVEKRAAWRDAAARSEARLRQLLAEWGVVDERAYADNTRETLRDETLTTWSQLGAVRRRVGQPTSSPRPIWALEPHFADLFDPTVVDDQLDDAVTDWTSTHMAPSARLKALLAHQQNLGSHATTVKLPDGQVRTLEPGVSSVILKGVIEQWAPLRLGDPVVLAISEPGAKLLVNDQILLTRLGIHVDVADLLPDALIADLAQTPVRFWVVEAVATDGVITESRKSQLEEWATAQLIDASSLSCLTAFASRNSPPARRRLKDIAVGTFAWFADEPSRELSWYALANDPSV